MSPTASSTPLSEFGVPKPRSKVNLRSLKGRVPGMKLKIKAPKATSVNVFKGPVKLGNM
jgi:hypothetical protein